jgi:catechol 2,3-dioxygenase-like lactoylglutathione lyase family enzyme
MEKLMWLTVRNLTFSSSDPARLAAFWSAATGYTERRDGHDEILLAPDDWGFPRFTFQRVLAPASPPGRLHLDLTADDMEAEVARLLGLGATTLWTVDASQSGTTTWTAMRDPDGNEFCVVQRPRTE